jgi:hypothetical protein
MKGTSDFSEGHASVSCIFRNEIDNMASLGAVKNQRATRTRSRLGRPTRKVKNLSSCQAKLSGNKFIAPSNISEGMDLDALFVGCVPGHWFTKFLLVGPLLC